MANLTEKSRRRIVITYLKCRDCPDAVPVTDRFLTVGDRQPIMCTCKYTNHYNLLSGDCRIKRRTE